MAHAESRPPIVEAEAVARAITLAESAGAWVHIVHLSSGDAADIVARARERGARVPADLSPVPRARPRRPARLGAFARCAPPIRDRSDVERLWARLADGTIDCITTDHCGFSFDTRLWGAEDIFQTPNGLPGIESFMPIVITEARARGFGWDDIARWTATAPARLWQLAPRKGAITVGADADLALVDPAAKLDAARRRPAPHPQVDAVRGSPGDGQGGAHDPTRHHGVGRGHRAHCTAGHGPVRAGPAGDRGGRAMSARLLLINPNTTESMTESMTAAARAVARPGTEVTGVTVGRSVPFIDGWYDEAVAAAAVAHTVYERAGSFDAAIVACFGDPGRVRRARAHDRARRRISRRRASCSR